MLNGQFVFPWIQGTRCLEILVPGRSLKKGDRPGHTGSNLEMESQLSRHGSGRDVVRPAERGQEVVQRFFVRHVNHCDPHAPFVPVAMEKVVLTNGKVKEVARLNALWIFVILLGSRRRRPDIDGPERVFGARRKRGCAISGRQWVWRDQLPVASEPGLERLVCG